MVRRSAEWAKRVADQFKGLRQLMWTKERNLQRMENPPKAVSQASTHD